VGEDHRGGAAGAGRMSTGSGTPARGVYKFLHSKHIDDVLLRGAVKIGGLPHYRGLEANSQWIADKLEGLVELDLAPMVITETENKFEPLLPDELKGRAIRLETGGKAIIEAPISISAPDVYLFCASTGDLTDLTDAMCREPQNDPYDACIRITDIGFLAHRLFYRGVVPELDGAKMSDICERFMWADVTYDVLKRNAAMGQAPSPSPFLKDVHFARQHEVRIAFFPRKPITRPTFVVHIPKSTQVFEELFRAVPPTREAAMAAFAKSWRRE
jgi:hypothetical protein